MLPGLTLADQPAGRESRTARLEAVRGDITGEAVDAVVNAANSGLLGGGGVDGAIHRAGGPAILAECRTIRARSGPLPPGEAVITTGGALPARHVIHTVGPVWSGGVRGEADILARCYHNSIVLASRHRLTTIAFPSISTGVYGYPVEQAAPIAVRAVCEALAGAPGLALVRFVLFSDRDLGVYARALAAASG